MNVTVVGSGYVGLVVGACLAETGNQVVCADIDERKIGLLNDGKSPIYEPGLDLLMGEHAERLSYTLDLGEMLGRSDLVFVAVDTPPTYSGDADLSRYIL